MTGPFEPWITEPGEYELDEAIYHADPVVGGSLSSTGARRLITSTPAQFQYERKNGRPDRAVFQFGRAAHREALGDGGAYIVIRGTGKDPNAWNTNITKAAVAKAVAAGVTPIKPDDEEAVLAMAAALREHPTAGPLLSRPGKSERSFVARDPESGVMCRVRFDRLVDPEPGQRLIAVDYKTTVSAAPDDFQAEIGRYGYHQQAAFYTDALRWLGLADAVQFVFVAQEKTPPYAVTVGWLDADAIEWGRVLNRKARDLFAQCTESGEWPGYPLEPVKFELPGWLTRQYEEADQDGAYLTIGDLAS